METAESMPLSMPMQIPHTTVPARTQTQTAEFMDSMSVSMSMQFPYDIVTTTTEMQTAESLSLSVKIQSQQTKNTMTSATYQISQPNVQVKLFLGPSSSNNIMSRKSGVRSSSKFFMAS
jgi:hypothetical protein